MIASLLTLTLLLADSKSSTIHDLAKQGPGSIPQLEPFLNDSDPPIRRLHSALEQWNISSGKSYQLAFSWGIAAYVTGSQVEDVLRAVDRQLYQKKHNLVPVF